MVMSRGPLRDRALMFLLVLAIQRGPGSALDIVSPNESEVVVARTAGRGVQVKIDLTQDELLLRIGNTHYAGAKKRGPVPLL